MLSLDNPIDHGHGGFELFDVKKIIRSLDLTVMSGEKRPASASFGSTQLVKRQKSDSNLQDGTVARLNGSNGGALIHGVSLPLCIREESIRAKFTR